MNEGDFMIDEIMPDWQAIKNVVGPEHTKDLIEKELERYKNEEEDEYREDFENFKDPLRGFVSQVVREHYKKQEEKLLPSLPQKKLKAEISDYSQEMQKMISDENVFSLDTLSLVIDNLRDGIKGYEIPYEVKKLISPPANELVLDAMNLQKSLIHFLTLLRETDINQLQGEYVNLRVSGEKGYDYEEKIDKIVNKRVRQAKKTGLLDLSDLSPTEKGQDVYFTLSNNLPIEVTYNTGNDTLKIKFSGQIELEDCMEYFADLQVKKEKSSYAGYEFDIDMSPFMRFKDFNLKESMKEIEERIRNFRSGKEMVTKDFNLSPKDEAEMRSQLAPLYDQLNTAYNDIKEVEAGFIEKSTPKFSIRLQEPAIHFTIVAPYKADVTIEYKGGDPAQVTASYTDINHEKLDLLDVLFSASD